MSKNISKDGFITLPSGLQVHPCRLIHKDGTLMWKHALQFQNVVCVPAEEYQEQHIVKTAQRLEELNSWVSQDLEPWECLQPTTWYTPYEDEMLDGYCVYFKHQLYDTPYTYEKLLPHIQEHESLELRNNYLFFRRC